MSRMQNEDQLQGNGLSKLRCATTPADPEQKAIRRLLPRVCGRGFHHHHPRCYCSKLAGELDFKYRKTLNDSTTANTYSGQIPRTR